MKTVAILGATGSVGSQTQDVARAGGLKVDLISAQSNVEAIERAAREFLPTFAVMTDERSARELSVRLADTPVRVLGGADALLDAINESRAETVVNSILGEAGLKPTIATLEAGKRLALANKESLVIAGDIVMGLADRLGGEIIPVDSEHSAIFQSLKAGKRKELRRIILTASGGPFFGKTREELSRVTLADTLRHPTWKMGRKITVDSATLMNKGFEVIEAVHLFGVPAEAVEVVIHRESILHSAVEYIDSSIIGELSVPDMRMCVEYAVSYPDREPSMCPPLDLCALGKLTFSRPDREAFPFLDLSTRAIAMGGAMPAVMNAADEVAVAAFLEERIGFTDIYDVVTETFEKMTKAQECRELDGIISSDREARRIANERIAALSAR